MRISGGQARGRTIKVPKGVRPASERVRLAVFSSLGSTIEGADVADLFCGSGAYGLEAMSRGAETATLVDNHAPAVQIARTNAHTVGLEVKVVRSDVGAFLRTSTNTYDVVFCDPPYNSFDPDLVSALRTHTRPGSVLVIETRWDHDPPATFEAYDAPDVRRYGDTQITRYLRH